MAFSINRSVSFNITDTLADTDTTGDYNKNHGKNNFAYYKRQGENIYSCENVTRGFRPLYSINRRTEDVG